MEQKRKDCFIKYSEKIGAAEFAILVLRKIEEEISIKENTDWARHIIVNSNSFERMWDGMDIEFQDMLIEVMIDYLDEIRVHPKKEADYLYAAVEELRIAQLLEDEEEDDYFCDNIQSILYHGTPTKNLASIAKYGLKVGNHGKVFLFSTAEAAKKLASRHGLDISFVLVDTKSAVDAGVKFSREDNIHGSYFTADRDIPVNCLFYPTLTI